MRVRIGLVQQKHIGTIERMLSAHAPLAAIADEIGWGKDAMIKEYIRHLKSKIKELESTK